MAQMKKAIFFNPQKNRASGFDFPTETNDKPQSMQEKFSANDFY